MRRRASAWLAAALLTVLVAAPDAARATPAETLAAGVEALIADAGKRSDAERLHRLFKLSRDYALQEFPEYATYVGIRGYNDRWTDHSAEAIARRKAAQELPAKALASIDRAALSPADRLNYDLFRRRVEERLEGRRFPWELMPINQLGGIQQSVPQMLGEQMPTASEADYEAILSRLRATPTLVDQTIALMKEGLRRGITPPKITVRDVAGRRALLVEDPATSPFLAAFRSDARGHRGRPERRTQGRRGEGALGGGGPGLTVASATSWRPSTSHTAAMSVAATALPDGQAWYAYRSPRRRPCN
jgi:uncharacterized protein (DUF885 family)